MMRRLFMNIVLTLIWVALTGNFQEINFAFGFFLSFLLMYISRSSESDKRYYNRFPKVIGFLFYFAYELMKANLQVAFDVITPRFYIKPGIISYPLTATTDLEITMLSNVISLTPGTLIIDVSDDRKVLYIHGMFIRDKQLFIDQIKNGFEKRILDILR